MLRAYHVWGEDCPGHLKGDFACAIWDGERRRLFCTRDPMSIKLFYYAHVGSCVIFSNTLDCIRQHPLVSRRLTARARGDFRLFRVNYELPTTVFADIRRLPGGWSLSASRSTVGERPSWQLPQPRQARYKDPSDYVDRFQEIMDRAVRDRLRTEHVTLLMSGGLDSTTIAATAVDVAARESRPLDLQARTGVLGHLLAHRERAYARALGGTTPPVRPA